MTCSTLDAYEKRMSERKLKIKSLEELSVQLWVFEDTNTVTNSSTDNLNLNNFQNNNNSNFTNTVTGPMSDPQSQSGVAKSISDSPQNMYLLPSSDSNPGTVSDRPKPSMVLPSHVSHSESLNLQLQTSLNKAQSDPNAFARLDVGTDGRKKFSRPIASFIGSNNESNTTSGDRSPVMQSPQAFQQGSNLRLESTKENGELVIDRHCPDTPDKTLNDSTNNSMQVITVNSGINLSSSTELVNNDIIIQTKNNNDNNRLSNTKTRQGTFTTVAHAAGISLDNFLDNCDPEVVQLLEKYYDIVCRLVHVDPKKRMNAQQAMNQLIESLGREVIRELCESKDDSSLGILTGLKGMKEKLFQNEMQHKQVESSPVQSVAGSGANAVSGLTVNNYVIGSQSEEELIFNPNVDLLARAQASRQDKATVFNLPNQVSDRSLSVNFSSSRLGGVPITELSTSRTASKGHHSKFNKNSTVQNNSPNDSTTSQYGPSNPNNSFLDNINQQSNLNQSQSQTQQQTNTSSSDVYVMSSASPALQSMVQGTLSSQGLNDLKFDLKNDNDGLQYDNPFGNLPEQQGKYSVLGGDKWGFSSGGISAAGTNINKLVQGPGSSSPTSNLQMSSAQGQSQTQTGSGGQMGPTQDIWGNTIVSDAHSSDIWGNNEVETNVWGGFG